MKEASRKLNKEGSRKINKEKLINKSPLNTKIYTKVNLSNIITVIIEKIRNKRNRTEPDSKHTKVRGDER